MATLFVNPDNGGVQSYLKLASAVRSNVPLSVVARVEPSALTGASGVTIFAIGTDNDRCSYELKIAASGSDIRATGLTTWAHLTQLAHSPVLPLVFGTTYYFGATWDASLNLTVYINGTAGTTMPSATPSLAPFVNYTSIGTVKKYNSTAYDQAGFNGCLSQLGVYGSDIGSGGHAAFAGGDTPNNIGSGLAQYMTLATAATAHIATTGSDFTTVQSSPWLLADCGEEAVAPNIGSYTRIIGF